MSSTARKWLAVVLAVGSATVFGLGMGFRSRTRIAGGASDQAPATLPPPPFASKRVVEAPAPPQAIGQAWPKLPAEDNQSQPQSQAAHAQPQGKVTPELKQAVDELRQQELDRLIHQAKQLSEPLSAQRR